MTRVLTPRCLLDSRTKRLALQCHPGFIQRIQTTACDLFSRSGYAGTSTKAIADAADVTEGSLFRALRLQGRALEAVHCASRLRELFGGALRPISQRGVIREERIRNAVNHFWKMAKSDHLRLIDYAILETPDLARDTYLREINVVTELSQA